MIRIGIPILKEDAALDRHFREKAEEIYDNVYRFIDNNIDEIIRLDKEYAEPWKNDTLIRNRFGGYTLDYGQLSNSINIAFYFLPDIKSGYAGGYAKDKETGKPVIILTKVLLSRWNPQYMNTRLGGAKQTIIHEIIHFFDELRGGSSSKAILPTKVTKDIYKDIVKDYFNSPLEFNAFYQEALSSLEGLLRRDEIRSMLLKDWNTFYSSVIKFFRQDFIENLNSKYLKKLQKRLYIFYQDII